LASTRPVETPHATKADKLATCLPLKNLNKKPRARFAVVRTNCFGNE